MHLPTQTNMDITLPLIFSDPPPFPRPRPLWHDDGGNRGGGGDVGDRGEGDEGGSQGVTGEKEERRRR